MNSIEAGTSIPDSIDASTPAPSSASDPDSGTHIADFIESLLVTVLLALFGTTFVVQAFKIPSESMEPTLLVGDHLLVNKFLFGGHGAWYEKVLPYREIARGDIIVFKFPYDDHMDYVKRVIGLPGDRIHVMNQRVYVNGTRLNEPYVAHDPSAGDSFGDDFPPESRYYSAIGLRPEWALQISKHIQNGELFVPPDQYFAMGDNREHSSDSRYWGFVDRTAIIGRPMLIYWSVDATSDDYMDRSVAGTIRGIERTLVHLASRTRWNRMLREVH